MAVAQSCAGDTGDNSEDSAEAIINAVDCVPDPASGLATGGIALGQKIFELSFWICSRFGYSVARIAISDEAAQLVVMFALFFDDLAKNREAGLVIEFLKLTAVESDGAALVNFKPAQGHAATRHSIGEAIGVASMASMIFGSMTTEFMDALHPKRGVLRLGCCHVAEGLAADGDVVAFGESLIGVIAAHLGLPIGLEGAQEFFVFLRVGISGRH